MMRWIRNWMINDDDLNDFIWLKGEGKGRWFELMRCLLFMRAVPLLSSPFIFFITFVFTSSTLDQLLSIIQKHSLVKLEISCSTFVQVWNCDDFEVIFDLILNGFCSVCFYFFIYWKDLFNGLIDSFEINWACNSISNLMIEYSL